MGYLYQSAINLLKWREGIVLPDGQAVKEIDESGYKYLGILGTDQLWEKETKTCSQRNINVG